MGTYCKQTNLENIALNERSQAQKTTYYLILCKISRIQEPTEREGRLVVS